MLPGYGVPREEKASLLKNFTIPRGKSETEKKTRTICSKLRGRNEGALSGKGVRRTETNMRRAERTGWLRWPQSHSWEGRAPPGRKKE